MTRLWTIPALFALSLSAVLPLSPDYPASVSLLDGFVASMGEYREGALLGKRGPTRHLPDPLLHRVNDLLHDERMAFDPAYAAFQQACGDPWPVYAGAKGWGATALSAVRDSVIFGGDCVEDNGDEWEGKVHKITSTASTDAHGTLRAAMDSIQDGRYDALVPSVGGRIQYQDGSSVPTEWTEGAFQIFGQAAPGEGLNITEKMFRCDGTGGTDDVVFRFLSLQISGLQGINCGDGARWLFDHLSYVFCANDSGSRNCAQHFTDAGSGETTTDVTHSYSLFAYPEESHPTGLQCGMVPRPDSVVTAPERATRMTVWRNAFGWDNHRIPACVFQDMEVVQNYYYGWGARVMEMGPCARYNWVGNYTDGSEADGPGNVFMAQGHDTLTYGHPRNQTAWEDHCDEAVGDGGSEGTQVYIDLHRHHSTTTPFQIIEASDDFFSNDVLGAGQIARCRDVSANDWCDDSAATDTFPTLYRRTTPVEWADTADFQPEYAAMSDALRDSLLNEAQLGVGKSQGVDSTHTIFTARLPMDTLAIHQAENGLEPDCGDGDADPDACDVVNNIGGTLNEDVPASGTEWSDSDSDGIPDYIETDVYPSCFTVGTDDFFLNCDNDKWLNGEEIWGITASGTLTDPTVTNDADGSVSGGGGGSSTVTFGDGTDTARLAFRCPGLTQTTGGYDSLGNALPSTDTTTFCNRDTLNALSPSGYLLVNLGDTLWLVLTRDTLSGPLDSATVAGYCTDTGECDISNLREVPIPVPSAQLPLQLTPFTPLQAALPHEKPKPEGPPKPERPWALEEAA